MPSIELELSRYTSREGEKLVQEGPEILFGRSMASDIQLRSDLVSRMHARVYLSDEEIWRLEDLSSRNGTFLNGRRVLRAELRAGDRLALGQGGPEVIVVALDPAPPVQAGEEEETRAIRVDPREFTSKPKSAPSRRPIPAEGDATTVPVTDDEDDDSNPTTAEMPTAEVAEESAGSKCHPIRFLLLTLVGAAIGFAFGLQVFGTSLPYREITAPALWGALQLDAVQALVPTGWLLPILGAVYGALLLVLLVPLRLVRLILLAIVACLHYGALLLLKDEAAMWTILDAAAALRHQLLG